MGISVVDGRAGTVVWVRRKDGSWWPGRIVGPGELTPSARLFDLSLTKTPIKLLGRENDSLDWYNLDKSNRIKAFRCGEFDDCIEKAESFLANPFAKNVRYARREDAILHALELEKKGFLKNHGKAGEKQAGKNIQAKRSRCIYLPIESDTSTDCKASNSQTSAKLSTLSRVGDDSPQSGSTKGNTSSTLTKFGGFKKDSWEAERDDLMKEFSGKHDKQAGNISYWTQNKSSGLCDLYRDSRTAAGLGVKKMKLNNCKLTMRPRVVIGGKNRMRFNSGRCNTVGDRSIFGAASKDDGRSQSDTKTGGQQVSEAGTLVHSFPRFDYLEKVGSQELDYLYIYHRKEMETTLMDVELTVQGHYQGGSVPLISLMSRLNGKAIIGHPIEIEASDDVSAQTFQSGEDNTEPKTFERDGNTILQLVWQTSRRTPVCYIPCQDSSTLKDNQTADTQKLSFLPSPKAREIGFSSDKFPAKPAKKPILSKREAAKHLLSREQNDHSNVDQTQPAIATSVTDGLIKKEKMPSGVVCVSVKLIYSRLLEAIG